MTDGLGAGFFAILLLAVLGGLALVVVVATVVATAYQRRAGTHPRVVNYLFAALCVAILGVAGFGVLVLYDEAPVLAWLFTAVVLLPFVATGVYFARTLGLSRLDAVATAVMAWGVPFFAGVGVAIGVMTGVNSVFDLAPVESRQLGVAWLAAGVGGLVVVLGMIAIGSRLREAIGSRETLDSPTDAETV